MSEEQSKKPKIDLKARLGKTTSSATGAGPGVVPLPVPGPSLGSVPPPAQASVPAPRPSDAGIAPPPSVLRAVPPMVPNLPGSPFAPHQPAAPAPAPPPPPPPPAAAQTIKVEIGEEIHEERKKASRRAAGFAVVGLVIGVGFGFLIGGGKERSDRDKVAVQGAAALEKDIKAANEKLEELKTKLNAGEEKLRAKAYPEELIAELAALNIPFDATNLDHKNVGNLKSSVQRALLSYTSGVEDLNRTKNQVRNLLGQPTVRKEIEKGWADEKEPSANFSVILISDQKGMMAELVPNKEPFAIGKDWPATYTVLRTERSQAGAKQVDKSGTRWQKGDPSRDLSGTNPVVVPVTPESSAGFTSQEYVRKLAIAIRDLRETIEGNSTDPTNERPGLVKVGDDLVNELHKIGLQQ
jgi:hypothetical protein